MNVPKFINEPPVTKDGNWHPAWQQFMTQLITQLQGNLSNEGYKVPQQDQTNITALETPKSTGALLYDSDNHLLKVNINGTWKTVQTL
jgi:hypothetical protein